MVVNDHTSSVCVRDFYMHQSTIHSERFSAVVPLMNQENIPKWRLS